MLVFTEGWSNSFASPQKPGSLLSQGRQQRVMVATESALALPDQDQAEGCQRGAVAGPLDLLDHEARWRPVDHAGALTDPQQPDREREKANDQKQSAHGVFLVRDRPRGHRARAARV